MPVAQSIAPTPCRSGSARRQEWQWRVSPPDPGFRGALRGGARQYHRGVATSETDAERIVTPQFARLWVGGFAQFLSFFLLLPALPVYARTLGIPDPDRLPDGRVSAAAMLVRPVAGWAADRYGRRPFLLGGALVFAVRRPSTP